MSHTITIVFSLFSLLLVTNLVFLLNKKSVFKAVPFSALLVIVGICLALATYVFPPLEILRSFELTPDLLFYVFLPILIFESAYNFHIRKFYENIVSISLLSTVGLFISTFAIGFALQFVFGLMGISAPLIYFLLFGALISATDPIAALSLFKTSGAPHRLSLMFEGESLFNDGTAVSVFAILLIILMEGVGVLTLGQGFALFVVMIIGGVLAGILLGRIFSYLLRFSASYEMVSLAFMLVMAHLVFLGSEMFNEYMLSVGSLVKISPIIATTIASLELGNNGRFHLSPRAGHFIEKYWEQLAFLSNSLIFLLVGMMTVSENLWSVEIVLPALVAVLVVTIARVLSVLPTVGFLNILRLEAYIPWSWTKMLAWGGLRGALALIVVLTIPDTLTLPGWNYVLSPKDFLVVLTLVVVISSLVIKSATIKFFMEKLGILKLSEEDEVRVQESLSFLATLKLEKLEKSFTKGYVDADTYEFLKQELQSSIDGVETSGGTNIFTSMLQSYAIGIERYFLQEIYARGEVTERVYRRILLKLEIQQEKIKQDFLCNASTTLSKALVAERMDKVRSRLAKNASKNFSVEEKFMYYRALAIIARKAIKEISSKQFAHGDDAVVQTILEKYEHHKDANNALVQDLKDTYPEAVAKTSVTLARKQLYDFGIDILERLKKTDFISSRVHAILHNKVKK